MRGLEELRNPKEQNVLIDTFTYSGRQFNIIQKELKALEIIKTKNITPSEILACSSHFDYLMFRGICENDLEENESLASKELTKEEYDLLKEVLK